MAVRMRQCQASLRHSGQFLPAMGGKWRPLQSLAVPSKRFLSLPVKPEEVDFENGELYNYTTRRFLINEKNELAKRRIRFDVNALGAVAAKSTGPRGSAAVNIEKVLEDVHTKTYMIQCDNGVKLMARILNPDEHQSKSSTISEVRTSRFAQSFANVPAPRHRHFAVNAEGHDVGCPFILSAAPKGVPLSSVWSGMNSLEQQSLMDSLMTCIAKWTHFGYPGYGKISGGEGGKTTIRRLSIDIDAAVTRIERYPGGREGQWYGQYRTVDEYRRELSNTAIGPVFTRDKVSMPSNTRLNKDLLGPWETSGQYLEGVAAFARARRDNTKDPTQNPRGQRHGSSAWYLDSTVTAARLYRAILPYITPQDDDLLKPALWKRNITADTIYVNPDASYRVKGILDWRYAEVAPGYRQVNQPPFFPTHGYAGSLSESETVHDVFLGLASSPRHYILQAMQFKKMTEYHLLECAHDMINDKGISFLARAIDYIRDERPDIAELLEDDSELAVTQLSKNFEGQIASYRRKKDLMQKVRAHLGDLVADDWTVRPEDYNTAKKALASAKERLYGYPVTEESSRKELEELWPFDD